MDARSLKPSNVIDGYLLGLQPFFNIQMFAFLWLVNKFFASRFQLGGRWYGVGARAVQEDRGEEMEGVSGMLWLVANTVTTV